MVVRQWVRKGVRWVARRIELAPSPIRRLLLETAKEFIRRIEDIHLNLRLPLAFMKTS